MVYSLNELIDRCRKGEKFEYTFFWGNAPSKDGEITKSCLSQWWMQSFEVDGVRYSCAEQYMMAQKAALFRDSHTWQRIMRASTPKEMKVLGRQVCNFDDLKWGQEARDIVRRGNIAKFGQNPKLLEFLASTKLSIIVEASPYDRVWGIGMDERCPEAKQPAKWKGENKLGFVLTEVRGILTSEKEG